MTEVLETADESLQEMAPDTKAKTSHCIVCSLYIARVRLQADSLEIEPLKQGQRLRQKNAISNFNFAPSRITSLTSLHDVTTAMFDFQIKENGGHIGPPD